MQKQMKKWWLLIILIIAGALAAAAAYRQFAGSGQAEKPLTTAKVQRRDIASSVQATGVIRARIGAEVKVGARVSGKVVRLYANIGDVVKKGQPLAVMEAMKMEHTIAAPADGTVAELLYAPGDQVAEGAELLKIQTA